MTAKPPTRTFDPERPAGVTLVELLVVMFILSILVALTVGVAGYVTTETSRKHTIAVQAQLMQAISVYEDAYGELPAEQTSFTYPNTKAYDTQQERNRAVDFRARHRNELLYDQLAAASTDSDIETSQRQEIAKLLNNLPAESKGQGQFLDGYGRAMDYRRDGVGGLPAIISGGPDGYFGPDDTGGRTDQNGDGELDQQDNIRSDRRT